MQIFGVYLHSQEKLSASCAQSESSEGFNVKSIGMRSLALGLRGESVELLKVSASGERAKRGDWKLYVQNKASSLTSVPQVDKKVAFSPLAVLSKEEFFELIEGYPAGQQMWMDLVCTKNCGLGLGRGGSGWPDVWDQLAFGRGKGSQRMHELDGAAISIKLTQEVMERSHNEMYGGGRYKTEWRIRFDTPEQVINYTIDERHAVKALKSDKGGLIKILMGAGRWDQRHGASKWLYRYLEKSRPDLLDQIKSFYDQEKIKEVLVASKTPIVSEKASRLDGAVVVECKNRGPRI